jgi:hypothetical protein
MVVSAIVDSDIFVGLAAVVYIRVGSWAIRRCQPPFDSDKIVGLKLRYHENVG